MVWALLAAGAGDLLARAYKWPGITATAPHAVDTPFINDLRFMFISFQGLSASHQNVVYGLFYYVVRLPPPFHFCDKSFPYFMPENSLPNVL